MERGSRPPKASQIRLGSLWRRWHRSTLLKRPRLNFCSEKGRLQMSRKNLAGCFGSGGGNWGVLEGWKGLCSHITVPLSAGYVFHCVPGSTQYRSTKHKALPCLPSNALVFVLYGVLCVPIVHCMFSIVHYSVFPIMHYCTFPIMH